MSEIEIGTPFIGEDIVDNEVDPTQSVKLQPEVVVKKRPIPPPRPHRELVSKDGTQVEADPKSESSTGIGSSDVARNGTESNDASSPANISDGNQQQGAVDSPSAKAKDEIDKAQEASTSRQNIKKLNEDLLWDTYTVEQIIDEINKIGVSLEDFIKSRVFRKKVGRENKELLKSLAPKDSKSTGSKNTTVREAKGSDNNSKWSNLLTLNDVKRSGSRSADHEATPKTLDLWRNIYDHVQGGGKLFIVAPKEGIPDSFYAKHPFISKSINYRGDRDLDLTKASENPIQMGFVKFPEQIEQLKKAGFMVVAASGGNKYYAKNAKEDKHLKTLILNDNGDIQRLYYKYKALDGFVNRPSDALTKLGELTADRFKPLIRTGGPAVKDGKKEVVAPSSKDKPRSERSKPVKVFRPKPAPLTDAKNELEGKQ